RDRSWRDGRRRPSARLQRRGVRFALSSRVLERRGFQGDADGTLRNHLSEGVDDRRTAVWKLSRAAAARAADGACTTRPGSPRPPWSSRSRDGRWCDCRVLSAPERVVFFLGWRLVLRTP